MTKGYGGKMMMRLTLDGGGRGMVDAGTGTLT